MACPARTARGRGRQIINFLGVDHIGRTLTLAIPARVVRIGPIGKVSPPAALHIAHGKPLHPHPFGNIAQQRFATLRNQQRNAQRIGEKPGRQQQGARKQDQRTMRQRASGIVHFFQRTAQIAHRRRPLRAHQRHPDRRRQQHQPQRRPKPEHPANLDEQPDLDQRHKRECQKQPHDRIFPCRCIYPAAVDLKRPLSYIGGVQPNTNRLPERSRMSSAVVQLLVLAAIAVFLILRLKNVLGTREGFEQPPEPLDRPEPAQRQRFEVIEGEPDHDIIDNVPEGSETAKALAAMKRAEPSFNVTDFLGGARGAYEMIVMAFETGDLDKIRPFLASDVAAAFEAAVAARDERGLDVQAEFIGLRELVLQEAEFDAASGEAEITVRFGGELISVARDAQGNIIEGDPRSPRKQRDIWTFARQMGSKNPNWQLVATGG